MSGSRYVPPIDVGNSKRLGWSYNPATHPDGAGLSLIIPVVFQEPPWPAETDEEDEQ